MAEKQIEKVMRIQKNPQFIRNICTSAHIHHGKTAFSDNLIAAAGLMSQELAGDALTLNFRQDEIDRCMTIDSANVSMVHRFGDDEFLINLIDTPGHVDFGGDVTRAMRAVDGTIVLVCGVEGIMPQTETVLKQALKERVKPILFINKVDRLIQEVKLTPEAMQERFVKIITHFNRLIEQIAEPEYKEKWQVNVADGSVGFGAARQNWGLSLPFMKKKNINFRDIYKIYEETENDTKERERRLFEIAPLYEVVMDMVVKHHPNPLEAQKYRVPKIWHGDPETEFGKDLVSCNPNGKLGFVIIKIVIDPLAGEISAGRLFSGTIRKGDTVYLNKAKQSQRIQNVFIYNGAKREIVDEIYAGNIIGIGGVKGTAGETVTYEQEEPFEDLQHIFEPVITQAIEPARPGDLPKLVEVLRQVGKEDPTVVVEINEETGENLMHGMGELHLEVIANRIKTEKGVEVKTSPPIVVYRETLMRRTQEVEGKSPNKHNKFYFIVEPIEPGVYDAIKSGRIHEGRIKRKDPELRKLFVEAGLDSDQAEKVKDIYRGNIFVDMTKGQVHMFEVIEMILDSFEDVMRNGPLAREPCIKCKVLLMDMKLHEDAIHRGPAQVYPAIREGIRGAMVTGNPVMFEPMQIMLIEAPMEYMGSLTKLVGSKRGQLLDMKQDEYGVTLKAKLPVMEMIGWSSDLRSETEGRGVSSLVDQMFEKLPAELQERVIRIIMERKGLKESQVGV